MAIGLRVVNRSYSISDHIATVSFTFELYDDQIVDANGNPVALDTKVITVRQNMLNPNARELIKQAMASKIQEYLEKAKVNMLNLLNLFGSLDANSIMDALQSDIENEIPTIIQNVGL